MSKNVENSMKFSDSCMNSKCNMLYGCCTNSHWVQFIYIYMFKSEKSCQKLS